MYKILILVLSIPLLLLCIYHTPDQYANWTVKGGITLWFAGLILIPLDLWKSKEP